MHSDTTPSADTPNDWPRPMALPRVQSHAEHGSEYGPPHPKRRNHGDVTIPNTRGRARRHAADPGTPFGSMALMLANACGGFLYLAIHAVLGEILKHHKRLVLGNLAAGFGVIAALILYFHLKA